jgi:hypothetical protein
MLRILIPILATVVTTFAQQKPEIAFRIQEKDIIPEGIVYDPASKVFYLGSIQKSKILKITKEGHVSDFIPSGAHGLKQVLGMKVQNGFLWACNNSSEHDSTSSDRGSYIHVFTATGKLHKVFKLADGKKHLFNDLVFSANGDAYITDSDGGAIYRIENNSDSLEMFLPANTVRYPNGIISSLEGDRILVSTGTGQGIVGIDLKTKEIKPVQHPKFMFFGVDGLYRHNKSWIAIQNVVYPESILRISTDLDETEIEDFTLLAADHESFDTPTTGVVVGDEFYFIANSQLLQIVGNKGVIKNPAELKPTLIMKIRLK